MRRRKLSDAERSTLSFDSSEPESTAKQLAASRQVPLFDQPKSEWPVHHPELLKPPGHYVGPVSDETGGPLNGNEAGRVVVGQSIRFAGHAYESGKVVCREHKEGLDGRGHGYRMTIYSGTGKDADLGQCALCRARVVGEHPWDGIRRQR